MKDSFEILCLGETCFVRTAKGGIKFEGTEEECKKFIKNKKAPKFKKHAGGRGGWSEWVFPTPKSYLFKCCDCGLIHEMQFKVFIKAQKGVGVFLPEPIRAMFRARRYKAK